jgi:hypothetical protein
MDFSSTSCALPAPQEAAILGYFLAFHVYICAKTLILSLLDANTPHSTSKMSRIITKGLLSLLGSAILVCADYPHMTIWTSWHLRAITQAIRASPMWHHIPRSMGSGTMHGLHNSSASLRVSAISASPRTERMPQRATPSGPSMTKSSQNPIKGPKIK